MWLSLESVYLEATAKSLCVSDVEHHQGINRDGYIIRLNVNGSRRDTINLGRPGVLEQRHGVVRTVLEVTPQLRSLDLTWTSREQPRTQATVPYRETSAGFEECGRRYSRMMSPRASCDGIA